MVDIGSTVSLMVVCISFLFYVCRAGFFLLRVRENGRIGVGRRRRRSSERENVDPRERAIKQKAECFFRFVSSVACFV